MISSIEEADAISLAEVIDEEHFEETQNSSASSASKIEENNNRSKECKTKKTRFDNADDMNTARRKERKRSYPEDDKSEHEPTIKVAGPWLDRRAEDQSGSIVTGVMNAHRLSQSYKKPFVQPFIQKLYDCACKPQNCDNAAKFTDWLTNRNGEHVTVTQVFN